MRRPGIWVANGTPGDPVKMLSWRPGALTSFYDYLHANHVKQYKEQFPDAPIIVRIQHPMNWQENPTQSARWHGELVVSKWPDLKDMDPYVYFANEMNLHYENGDNNPANQHLYETPEFYKRYASWVKMTADYVKQHVPEMKLVCPPFAFGHHEDGAPDDNGDPKDGWAGYDSLADTIRTHFDNIITFHAYWGDQSGYIPARLYDPDEASWYAFRWRRVLKLFEKRYNIQGKMIIDEAGNMDASVPDFTSQVIYYANECLKDGRVLALTYFLWQDPTGSPGNIINSWADRISNLNQHVADLKAMPNVPVAPGLPPGETVIRVLMPDGTVKVMLLEEYLRGVVPVEMPSSWPLEALKVQAVAARSYAQAAINHPRHAAENADICTTTHCQAYDARRVSNKSDQAVSLTKGQVILYQGKLATAYYSANCGGHTVGNETGFGGPPLPYLRPVPCINPGPKNGHAVGMCQWGTHDMAERGDDYVTILKHYYTDVTLPFEPTPGPGIIRGVLRDKNGTPQPNYEVTLTGTGVLKSTTTNPNGEYRFENLSAGTYVLRVTGTSIEQPVYSTGQAPVIVDLTLPSEPVCNQGVVRGTLRNSSGVPQADREIVLTGPNLTRTATTDNNGVYRFDQLPDATYMLSVSGTEVSQSVTVQGDAPVTVDLTLPPEPVAGQGIIGGRLLDASGNPVPGQQITLMGPSLAKTVNTDNNGVYRFDQLPVGTYIVSVVDTEIVKHVWSDGKTPVILNLVLPPELPAGHGAITGTLRNYAGVPQPGRQIILTGAAVSLSDITDSNGIYRFDGLPAGAYILTVVGTSLAKSVWSNGQVPITVDLTI